MNHFHPIELRCEHSTNPIGIDTTCPRFSWSGPSTDLHPTFQVQTAYQVQVGTSRDQLNRDIPDMWDSEQVESGESTLVSYKGVPLESRRRYYWRVRIWDTKGQSSEWSDIKHWETGLLEQTDWIAKWIGYTAGWNGQALYFRSRFTIESPVAQARAYISGLGYYEFRLNGKKIGNHVLDPGWTDYSKRILYASYDITQAIHSGGNVIGAIVGNGWYGMPILLLQIHILHTDGSETIIATEGGHSMSTTEWYVSCGPIQQNSIYDGEHFDARKEKEGWDWQDIRNPMGDADREAMWQTAVEVPAPAGILVAQDIEPIEVTNRWEPAKCTQLSSDSYLFDAGVNLAGWIRLQAVAPAGTTVNIHYAETLASSHQLSQDNLQKAAQSDSYTFKGSGMEIWEPSFTYHGFRYVKVTGLPGPIDKETVQICQVRSSVAPNGKFQSSHHLLNQIQEMVVQSEASNLHSIPTDCPQRGERLGWLNDMTVRSEQGIYNFHLARLYRKWIDDIADTQDTDGSITDTAPFKWGKRPADPVSASFIQTAWHLCTYYGDRNAIDTHYHAFGKWVDCLLRMTEEGLLNYSSWGDWAPPKAHAIKGSVSDAVSKETPSALVSTAHLFHQLNLLVKMGALVGDKDGATLRLQQAKEIHDAFNKTFWDSNQSTYASGNQASNAIALYFELVPPAQREDCIASLVKAVEKENYHLSTGNLATKYLLEALSLNGQHEIAYRIATQETYPSWGYMLANGATTLWERWEHATGNKMNSHNHPMLGSVSSWMYRHLAGIQANESGPGFSSFYLEPKPAVGLQHIEASYNSPKGPIHCHWQIDLEKFRMDFSVPTNTRAEIHLPFTFPESLKWEQASTDPLSKKPGTYSIGAGHYTITGLLRQPCVYT